MREIKFRAKRIDNGEWVYGFYVFSYMHLIHEGGNGSNIYVVNPETVGQYTGLKDKNGVEIFEGDIVKYTQVLYTDCSRTEVLSIKEPVLAKMYYSDGIYLAMKTGNIGRFLLPGLIDSEELEVIGNIYEHPHLLGGTVNER